MITYRMANVSSCVDHQSCKRSDEASLRWRQLYKLLIQLIQLQSTKLVALCSLLVLQLFSASAGLISSLSSFSLPLSHSHCHSDSRSEFLHFHSPRAFTTLRFTHNNMQWRLNHFHHYRTWAHYSFKDAGLSLS